MARLLQRYLQPVEPCAYLPDRSAALDTMLLLDVTVHELDALLVRGWRRFGPAYFRPQCAPCSACVPIRVPTERFVASKSQRRARRSGEHLRVELGVPRVDPQRLALYARWHASREAARGWRPNVLDARSYKLEFALPHPAVRELAFYDDDAPDAGPEGKLVGIGLCDVTPRCWSAVYFFFDPSYARASLGVLNVMLQLELAYDHGIPHVYLGYRVAGCASLRYKSRYRPHETLVGWPALDEQPVWVERDLDAEDAAGSEGEGGRSGASDEG